MTSHFVVLPSADRDLDDQAGYLANEAGLATALTFLDAAAATLEKLARTPGLGETTRSSRNVKAKGANGPGHWRGLVLIASLSTIPFLSFLVY